MPKKKTSLAGRNRKRASSTEATSAVAPERLLGKPEPHHHQTELKLPLWLPQPIADYIRITFPADFRGTSDETLLSRLSSDRRMVRVWNELLKRNRVNYKSSEKFKNPATSPRHWDSTARAQRRRAQGLRARPGPINEVEAEKLELYATMYSAVPTWDKGLPIQERALVAFFGEVLRCARGNSVPMSRADAQAKRAYYLGMASRIRADVAQLDSFPRHPLIEAVFAYEELADKTAPSIGDPLLVERKRRGDERQNGFVIELVTSTNAIFGSSLYGIVAIVTNIAFGCEDWTAQKVRKMTKHTLPLISGFRAS